MNIFLKRRGIMDVQMVKSEVIQALGHIEAEDGLYLQNFLHVHDEDCRPLVNASQQEVLDALTQLIAEGAVRLTQLEEQVIFQLTH